MYNVASIHVKLMLTCTYNTIVYMYDPWYSSKPVTTSNSREKGTKFLSAHEIIKIRGTAKRVTLTNVQNACACTDLALYMYMYVHVRFIWRQ